MFYGTLTAGSSVSAASSYIFNQSLLTNTNLTYNSSTGLFTFRTPGLYKITFSTSGSGTGIITPTLVLSGNISTTALAKMSPTADTDFRSCSFESVVRVNPSNNNTFATMNIINNGAVSQTVSSGDIIIERIA
nr:MAG TPA: EMILIN-1-1, C1Q-like domain, Homotrimeric protein [Caudoviricetes sp.]